jgi:hypothetical protein
MHVHTQRPLPLESTGLQTCSKLADLLEVCREPTGLRLATERAQLKWPCVRAERREPWGWMQTLNEVRDEFEKQTDPWYEIYNENQIARHQHCPNNAAPYIHTHSRQWAKSSDIYSAHHKTFYAQKVIKLPTLSCRNKSHKHCKKLKENKMNQKKVSIIHSNIIQQKKKRKQCASKQNTVYSLNQIREFDHVSVMFHLEIYKSGMINTSYDWPLSHQADHCVLPRSHWTQGYYPSNLSHCFYSQNLTT